jgi:asparagine synthase (glutamine-hydrolysing)
MCGILGYIGNCNEANFKASLDRIAHRGPDGYGISRYDGAILGHRRLSIIDLSDNGKQPMEILDRYAITFNGEIYNYLEIKKQLQDPGIKFKSNSDTEVLLFAYLHWGVKCFNMFNGMWALAIWDKQEKTLLLSRDRVGKKPLFYHQKNNVFAFCSEMKGLYGFFDAIEIDYETVNSAILDNFGYESTEKCLIKGIKRFPSASYAILKNNELKISSFWEPLQHKVSVSKDYEEHVEQFRELFLDACKIRMRSDVTIGTALSGGLDSSSVICSMAHIANAQTTDIQKNWQHAFVASFPNTSIDETAYAKQVTDHLSIRADFIEIDPVVELNDIYKQTYLFEEIYYAPTIPFVQLYRKIKQSGVVVSIDGHGADELFAGYPFDMAFALPDALPSIFQFKEVLKAINQTSGKPLNHDFKNKLKFALLNKFPVLQSLAKNTNLLDRYGELGFLNSKLYESTFKTVLPTLLRNYDRYAMINGVEIRMPFLDYRIIEFAFSIPHTSKINNGFGKSIVRDAMKNYVPHDVLYRKNKIGFNSPMHVWMNSVMKEWITDTINSQSFNQSTLINPDKTRREIMSVLNQKELTYKQGEQSFAKLIPFIWEKSLNFAYGD